LPQRLLGLDLVKVGWWHADVPLLLLHARNGDIWAGRSARDDDVSAPCVSCRGITQPSSRITSTPAAGSGAGAGQFSHWPHPGGGASSQGSPPRPLDRPRWEQAPVEPSSPQLPPPLTRHSRAPHHPWRSRRAPPRRHGRIRPERLNKREGGDGRCHPANAET
jgi:hypothetical protein